MRHDHFWKINAFVVPFNVPLLLGLDVIKLQRLIMDFAKQMVESQDNNCLIPLELIYGQIYLEWPNDIV